MDILELMTNCKNIMPDLLSSYCFVNGAIMPLSEIDKMGYEEFSLRSKINMPVKLYRYFPNIEKDSVNYSLIALQNNTVYMQAPSNFDDVYDSDIDIDFMTYQKHRLLEYCRRCGSFIDENNDIQNIGNEFVKLIFMSYNKYKDFSHMFIRTPKSALEEKSNELFRFKLELGLTKGNDIGCVISKIISEEYSDYVKRLKNTFRVACFTTSPYSQLMWGGAYADCHRGFCVEYTILPNDEKYRNVYLNLFPLIYCKVRPDVSWYLVSQIDCEPDLECLWKIYSQGALRKSIDWMYKCEWRLLLPLGDHNQDNYNVEFFPITKVYLGNRMEAEKRRKIIDICKSKNIP